MKAILDAAQETDLIVMATEGRHGFVDAIRGSVTERVVHDAPCPVLAPYLLGIGGQHSTYE